RPSSVAGVKQRSDTSILVSFATHRRTWRPISSVGSTGEEPEQALEARIGVGVDMVRHLIIHERKVFVPNDAAGVAHLGDAASAMAPVGGAPMPKLGGKHRRATGWGESTDEFALPRCPLQGGRRAWPEQVGTRDY